MYAVHIRARRDPVCACVLACVRLCLSVAAEVAVSVVGVVVIHAVASLILLCGWLPCQEAPAWPPAHQPHLAPSHSYPAAHTE
ncbi:hypothetical protein QQF64_003836 [Cirrhinus molitorella]|uniref:Uncharacterized protein n=1 Tax=Cirrhinus molitorella TaxID=172907 RepID=A0ABR3MMG7_9TELE